MRTRYGKGNFYSTSEVKKYKGDVMWIWFDSKQELLHGVLEFNAVWYSDEENKSDIDSRLKDALDGLNGLAYHDDRQIKKLSIMKLVDVSRPRIEVEITPIQLGVHDSQQLSLVK